jgi:hypothetical protein
MPTTEYYPKNMEPEISTGIKADYRVRLAEQFMYKLLEGGSKDVEPTVELAYALAYEFVRIGEAKGILEPSVLRQEDLVEQQVRMQVHANEFGQQYTALRGGTGRTIPGRKS